MTSPAASTPTAAIPTAKKSGTTTQRPRKPAIDLQGAVLLVFFSALMGFNQPLIRLVNEAFNPMFQAGLRSILALPLIVIFALLMRRRLSFSDGTFWPGLLAGVFFSAEFLLMFIAVELTAVSRTAILFYTMPFWVALGAHFLIPGERLTPRRVLGLVLAVIGVSIAFSEPSEDAGPYQLVGDLLALAGAAAWAALGLTARVSRLSHATPEMQLVYQLLVSAVLLTALAPLYGDPVRDPTATTLGIFAFQIVVVVCIGYVTWFWALSIYPASDMASYSFLAPVFGVVASWLVLGETLSADIIASLALVGLGIFLVNWRRRRRTTDPSFNFDETTVRQSRTEQR